MRVMERESLAGCEVRANDGGVMVRDGAYEGCAEGRVTPGRDVGARIIAERRSGTLGGCGRIWQHHAFITFVIRSACFSVLAGPCCPCCPCSCHSALS